MKVFATNILWDIDNIDLEETPMDLPDKVEIPIDFIEKYGSDAIADYLSDKYNYCVYSFSLENEDNTFLYLVYFQYANDDSTWETGHEGLIESEIDLYDIPKNMIREDYRIKEILEKEGCTDIVLNRISSLDGYCNMLSYLEDVIYLSEEDFKEIEEEKER